MLEKFVVGCDEGACNRGSASRTILTSIRDSGDSGIFGESLVKSTVAMASKPRSPSSIREQAVGELGSNRHFSWNHLVFKVISQCMQNQFCRTILGCKIDSHVHHHHHHIL